MRSFTLPLCKLKKSESKREKVLAIHQVKFISGFIAIWSVSYYQTLKITSKSLLVNVLKSFKLCITNTYHTKKFKTIMNENSKKFADLSLRQ